MEDLFTGVALLGTLITTIALLMSVIELRRRVDVLERKIRDENHRH